MILKFLFLSLTATFFLSVNIFASEQEPLLITKCKTCHGQNFEKKAFERAAILKGQKASNIETSLLAYQAGKQNKTGMGVMMRGQVKALSATDIKMIANYIENYKEPSKNTLYPPNTNVQPVKQQATIRDKMLLSCLACHGESFEKPALNKSSIVKGQSASKIQLSLLEYKAGTRNIAGFGALMTQETVGFSNEDIAHIAAYISEIK